MHDLHQVVLTRYDIMQSHTADAVVRKDRLTYDYTLSYTGFLPTLAM